MSKKIGCLILHGFAGNLGEIENINQFLINKGFETACPTLKGHGLTKKELATAKHSDWISSAEESLKELSKKCDRVVLIGFSMGGLVAINLAMKYDVYKIITLSSPIYHWDLKRIGINIISDAKVRKTVHLRSYINSAVNIPLRAMVHFKLLVYKTKPLLNQITCPIFIAQGLLDGTVKYKSAHYIYRNVASEQKFIKFYDHSPHLICTGEDCEELFQDVENFINLK